MNITMTKYTTTILTLLFITTLSSTPTAKTINITNETWEESTKAKSLFLKFCSSTCFHCNEMKIPWEVLEEEYEENEDVIIGTINCDVESKLCEEFNIIGTPTLYYGDRNSLQEYAGDKSFAKLHQFTKQELITPICSPERLNACNDLDRSRIESWVKMSVDEIQDMIQNVNDELKNVEEEFDSNMAKLQTIYDDFNSEYVSNKANIQRELKMLKSVLKD